MTLQSKCSPYNAVWGTLLLPSGKPRGSTYPLVLGGQKNEGVVGDQGIDAMLFEDAKIAVLRLPSGDLPKAVRSRNKNPAPPRLQVPSAFASDLSVCDATGWGDLAGGDGGVEAANTPII